MVVSSPFANVITFDVLISYVPSATWHCVETTLQPVIKSTTSSTLHAPSARLCLVPKTRTMSTKARCFATGTIPPGSPPNVLDATRPFLTSLSMSSPINRTAHSTPIVTSSTRSVSFMRVDTADQSRLQFWNVKVVPRPPVLPILPSPDLASPAPVQLTYVAEEQQTTAESIKAAQLKMEARVYAIQTSLSGFEESSAACISDMLDHVGAGIYLDATRASERFILHVEVLFAATDEIEDQFAQDVPHDREARELCRKTVDLFTLMCNAPDRSGSGRTEEMLALVTGIADYLKSLVRVALARSLELEQELADGGVALDRFLERIKALAESGSDIYAQRLDPATYGYRSLVSEIAGESPFVGPEELDTASSSDLCVACGLGVEEDCVRLGACQRWHVGCVKCAWEGCTRAHLQAPKKESPGVEASVRRPRVQVDRFVYEPPKGQERVGVVYCTEHGSVPPCRAGFEAVSRLEQYAFLMSVASRRAFLGCD
ncbi:hypothetical protein ACGC1H_003725 [Rhizoctonia solani]